MRKLIFSGFILLFSSSFVLAQTPGIDTTGQRTTKYPKVDTTAKRRPQFIKIDTTAKKTSVPGKIDTTGRKTPTFIRVDTTRKVQKAKTTGISTKDIQAERGFELREVKFKRFNKDVILVSGKLTNKSGRDYSKSATFEFFIFDKNESILGNGTIRVSGLNHNGTVNFSGKIYSRADHNQIGKYKIQFVKGS